MHKVTKKNILSPNKWSLMFYLDVQNVLNYKAQQPDLLVNTQEDGSVIKIC